MIKSIENSPNWRLPASWLATNGVPSETLPRDKPGTLAH